MWGPGPAPLISVSGYFLQGKNQITGWSSETEPESSSPWMGKSETRGRVWSSWEVPQGPHSPVQAPFYVLGPLQGSWWTQKWVPLCLLQDMLPMPGDPTQGTGSYNIEDFADLGMFPPFSE